MSTDHIAALPTPPPAPPPMGLGELAERLVDRLRELSPVAVAFSGGVDSALVAKAAFLANPDSSLAVTAVSPSLAHEERRMAAEVAREIGIRHIELNTREFERDEYRSNPANRCFHCKTELYTTLKQFLEPLGPVTVVNGANLDDCGDYRPGMQAARDFHVVSPLIDLQITKQQVRELANHWKLTIWQKPASPCLASRIAYGIPVTEERVARIEAAEALLRELLPSVDLRVRCEAGELARIEVPTTALPTLVDEAVRMKLVSRLRSLGFRAVTLDLAGFQSGNLNALVQLSPAPGADTGQTSR